MTKTLERHPYSAFALLFAVLLVGAVALLSLPGAAHSQVSSSPLNGYAWSDNIGWISLNCATGGSGGSNICGTSNYGLSIDSSGALSGYAWSDNIGWISANSSDLAGCPSAPCTASISGSTLSGWLKVLAADNNGWDGWISLSGANYGVTMTGGAFSGYAWGSDVVGWTDFEYASTTYGTCTPSYSCADPSTIVYTGADCTPTTYATCVTPAFCSAGSAVCIYPAPTPIPSGNLSGNLTLSPQLTPKGTSVQVSWNIGNVVSCTVVGTNGDSWSGTSGLKTSSPISQQIIYTLTCVESDPNAPAFTETAVANIVPTYQER